MEDWEAQREKELETAQEQERAKEHVWNLERKEMHKKEQVWQRERVSLCEQLEHMKSLACPTRELKDSADVRTNLLISEHLSADNSQSQSSDSNYALSLSRSDEAGFVTLAKKELECQVERAFKAEKQESPKPTQKNQENELNKSKRNKHHGLSSVAISNLERTLRTRLISASFRDTSGGTNDSLRTPSNRARGGFAVTKSKYTPIQTKAPHGMSELDSILSSFATFGGATRRPSFSSSGDDLDESERWEKLNREFKQLQRKHTTSLQLLSNQQKETKKLRLLTEKLEAREVIMLIYLIIAF